MKTIKGVEIFSAGEWNGDKYSVEDLDQIVDTFNMHVEHVRPFLKLGHSDNQKLLAEDGLPAAGWVQRIYRSGEKLLADFVDIPAKIYELIEKRAYRKVSSEIYWNVKIKDKSHKYMLGAVALLGAETPGVMNLSDILSMYGLKDYSAIKSYAESQTDVRLYSFDLIKDKKQEDERMNLEQQLAAEKAKNAALEQEKTKYAADLETEKKRAEKAEADKAEAEKKVFATETEKKQIALEKEVDQLIAEKVITKGMRPYALALMGDEPTNEKKTYSLKVAEKDVELSKIEVVKELAKLFAKKSEVNLEEGTEDGDTKSQKQETASIAEVEKYAAEHKLSFSDAARALYRKVVGQQNKTDVKED